MEKTLADLIARLPIPGLKQSSERHIIAQTLSKILNIPITPKQIQVKEGVVIVSVPPVMKSMLHIKETQIREELQKENISILGIK